MSTAICNRCGWQARWDAPEAWEQFRARLKYHRAHCPDEADGRKVTFTYSRTGGNDE